MMKKKKRYFLTPGMMKILCNLFCAAIADPFDANVTKQHPVHEKRRRRRRK